MQLEEYYISEHIPLKKRLVRKIMEIRYLNMVTIVLCVEGWRFFKRLQKFDLSMVHYFVQSMVYIQVY